MYVCIYCKVGNSLNSRAVLVEEPQIYVALFCSKKPRTPLNSLHPTMTALSPAGSSFPCTSIWKVITWQLPCLSVVRHSIMFQGHLCHLRGSSLNSSPWLTCKGNNPQGFPIPLLMSGAGHGQYINILLLLLLIGYNIYIIHYTVVPLACRLLWIFNDFTIIMAAVVVMKKEASQVKKHILIQCIQCHINETKITIMVFRPIEIKKV